MMMSLWRLEHPIKPAAISQAGVAAREPVDSVQNKSTGCAGPDLSRVRCIVFPTRQEDLLHNHTRRPAGQP